MAIWANVYLLQIFFAHFSSSRRTQSWNPGKEPNSLISATSLLLFLTHIIAAVPIDLGLQLG